jgi:hypothetical protein
LEVKEIMKIFFIYVFIDHNTGNPAYVGKGCRNRLSQYPATVKSGRKSHLFNWMRKYEKLNGSFPVPFKIAEGLTGQEACDFERALIAFYGRQDIKTGCLFNLTDGGEGTNGHIVSEETKEKMSESRKGWKPSPETIAKRLASMAGYIVSDETKEKMRQAQTGRKQTSETKAKISAIVRMRGTVSAETCAKISASNKGKKRGGGSQKGRIVSTETRVKMSAAMTEFRKAVPPANKGKTDSDKVRLTKSLAQRERRMLAA